MTLNQPHIMSDTFGITITCKALHRKGENKKGPEKQTILYNRFSKRVRSFQIICTLRIIARRLATAKKLHNNYVGSISSIEIISINYYFSSRRTNATVTTAIFRYPFSSGLISTLRVKIELIPLIIPRRFKFEYLSSKVLF